MNIARTEQIVVASLLTRLDERIGPCVSTAIAYAPQFWESPEASKLAEGIGKVLRRGMVPSVAMIKAMVEPEYRQWIDHPTFQEGLPMGLAEVEARSLLPHYKNKRLLFTVATTYERMMTKPDAIPQLAMDLKLKLEDLL